MFLKSMPLHLVTYLSCLVTDLFKPFLVGILLVDSEVGSFSRKFLQRLHPLEWLDNYLGDCKLNCFSSRLKIELAPQG
jgi:hypothetical protein